MGTLIAGLSNSVGLPITGIAFLVMYAVYLPLVYWLAKRRIGFHWQQSVTILFLSILMLCIFVFILSSMYWWGGIVTVILALTFIIYTVVRLANMSGLSGHLSRFSTAGMKAIKKLRHRKI
jgi:PST family polysaccharide transporter